MFIFSSIEIIVFSIGLLSLLYLAYQLTKKTSIRKALKNKHVYIPVIIIIICLLAGLVANRTYPPHFAMPPFMHAHTPDGLSPSLPLFKVMEFFLNRNRFTQIADIGANPNTVPTKTATPDSDGIIRFYLTAKEVLAQIAPGIWFNYWTFDNQVPGPMLRVRVDDTVEIALTNDSSSLHPHNIDLHAVTGPGGGAVLTNVAPGETKTFRFKALNPGLYVYHCAMPNVSTHNSHGQYGLILVEPKEGFSPVDKEFYLMQGELYTRGQLGKKGLTVFDSQALLDAKPNYITFNGRIENTPRMQAQVGDKIRLFVGNGGVNLISSFHVIGEIFDTVYPNASINGALEHNTQTAQVLPGGASIIEFTVEVPGKYLIVDHALARMNKGAWAVLEVLGEDNPEIFMPVTTTQTMMHN